MSEGPTEFGIAPIRNVAALLTLVERIENRDINLPGLGVFYGRSGYGKTSAATMAANQFQAHSIQVKESWSATHFLDVLLGELSVPAKGTMSQKLDKAATELMKSGRPLLIDDVQYMSTSRKIGLIRDIYESSQTTIILIGEEELPHTLTRWENVHNRIYEWVGAEPCNIHDAKHLAPIYARGIDVDPELLELIVKFSTGSMRRVATNLAAVKSIALGKGLNALGPEHWDISKFNTGQPPASRKLPALPEPPKRVSGPSAKEIRQRGRQ